MSNETLIYSENMSPVFESLVDLNKFWENYLKIVSSMMWCQQKFKNSETSAYEWTEPNTIDDKTILFFQNDDSVIIEIYVLERLKFIPTVKDLVSPTKGTAAIPIPKFKDIYDFIEATQMSDVTLTLAIRDKIHKFNIIRCSPDVTETQLNHINQYTDYHVCGVRALDKGSKKKGTFELVMVINDCLSNYIVQEEVYNDLVMLAREILPDTNESDDGELYFTDFVVRLKPTTGTKKG